MRIFICVLALLPWASAARSAPAERQSETVRYAFSPAGRIAVENVHGSIRVNAWSKPEVKVTIVKSAPAGCHCLDDASVTAERRPESLSLITVYSGSSTNPVQVDYEIEAPGGSRLDALRTVDGDIAVEGVEGGVTAQTLRGNIAESNVSGPLSGRALDGDIGISMRRARMAAGGLNLETITGNIFLTLPPHPNAMLSVATVAGKIECPHGLELAADNGGDARRAQFGRGGPMIRLSTVRGDIHVEESGGN